MHSIGIQKYKEFCQNNEEKISVFFQPYWLDIVCYNGEWNVILSIDNKGIINGVLVYFMTKKYGQSIITNPPLTPFTGIIILDKNEFSDSTKIIENLIFEIPQTMYFSQSCMPTFKNWLPMFWKHYNQTSRITYIIENIKQWNYGMCNDHTQRKIKKGNALYTIKESENIKDIFDFSANLWALKKIMPPINETQFRLLDHQLAIRSKRKILITIDKNNKIHSAVYLIFDQNTAYSLLISSDPFNRNNYGAVHYLLSEAIIDSSKVVDRFNFEGSMINGLAQLYSSFGAKQELYHRIYKAKNIFWDILYRIKNHYDKNIR